jgi:glucokinase
MKYAVGVDLGGTNIVTILMNEKGKIITRDKRATEVSKGKNHVLKRISGGIESVLGPAARSPQPAADVAGIGIGTPGLVNLDKGILYESPNFPDWNNVPLARIFKKRFDVPVFIENDANSAALGEWWIGAGKRTRYMICLTLGTGIGGGIIIDGKVYHGANGFAGELGHISLSFDGPKCGCGNVGCLETYAPAIGIIRRTKEALKKNRKSLIYKLIGGNLNKVTPAIVTQAARKGDKLAGKIWDDTGYYLGSAIADYVNIFNPEIVVLTGGLTGAGNLLFKPMWKTVRKRAFRNAVKNLKILPGKIPDDAGAVGAAKTAFQRAQKNTP